MRIVIDTNVMISGVFFGGFPRRVIEAVVDGRITACATREIVEEYLEIIREMIACRQGTFGENFFQPLMHRLRMIEAKTSIELCRDPDDDKFIACAIDGGCLYIVSGDRDLLELNRVEGIEIITARKFCEHYLDYFS
ncbi:MAG: putative toxin-antitoxin system toxin component, PIN family [Clostridia bacterium]|nr:putative toxin-antitoxin system toxin component, PIN family [Clostridia bacterium]